jgi:hypothetical protein
MKTGRSRHAMKIAVQAKICAILQPFLIHPGYFIIGFDYENQHGLKKTALSCKV